MDSLLTASSAQEEGLTFMMAQLPLPSPIRETNDVLNLASQAVASMRTQRSAATSEPLPHLPCHVPQFPVIPMPPAMPFTLPASSSTMVFSYPRAHQNGVKSQPSDVATHQTPDPSKQSGKQGEPEYEMSRDDEQQDDKMLQEAGAVGADVDIAETQEKASSDDLSDADLSDGLESPMSPEPEDELDRLDKNAFNYAGQAYDHQVPQHLTGGTTLFAKKVTQGITILEHLESPDNQDKSNTCPNLVPQELEMKRTTRAVECIWVGMLPNPQNSPKRAASASAQPESQADVAVPAAHDGGDNAAAKQQLDGTSNNTKTVRKKAKKCQAIVDIEDDQLDIIAYNPIAFRVVAKKMVRKVKAWHLYALATSGDNSKLCEGWKVHSDEVFFFKAFRDDTVAGLMKRRHASDFKIKAVIFPPEAAPRLINQSSTLVTRSISRVSTPATPTPTPDGLPSHKTPGRKGKAPRTVGAETTKKASEAGDVLDQVDDEAETPVGSAEDANGPDADSQSAAGLGPKEPDPARQETDQAEQNGTVCDDGDEDTYPEHAVPATSPSYKNYIDDMMACALSGFEPTNLTRGEKRKRVAFVSSCEELANTRRKMSGGPSSNAGARDGSGREGSASFVVQQNTDHLAQKLKSMIDKLAAKQDVAGLRQCVTLAGSIERRSCPGPASALAPYLNIISKKDADTGACERKLREILVSVDL